MFVFVRDRITLYANIHNLRRLRYHFEILPATIYKVTTNGWRENIGKWGEEYSAGSSNPMLVMVN